MKNINNESLKLLKLLSDIVQNGSNEDILNLDGLIQSIHSKACVIRNNIEYAKEIEAEKRMPDKDLIVKYPISQNVTDTIADYYTTVLKRTFPDELTTELEIELVREYLQDHLQSNRGQKEIFNGGCHTETIGNAIKKTVNHAHFYESIKEENEIDKQKLKILSNLNTKLQSTESIMEGSSIDADFEGISISENNHQIIGMTLDGRDKLYNSGKRKK
ncbi:MAG: hypothetical protein HFJ12_02615 [Bacilli bacterium]|nr:hypothetical protein [Bacilli bacterium]